MPGIQQEGSSFLDKISELPDLESCRRQWLMQNQQKTTTWTLAKVQGIQKKNTVQIYSNIVDVIKSQMPTLGTYMHLCRIIYYTNHHNCTFRVHSLNIYIQGLPGFQRPNSLGIWKQVGVLVLATGLPRSHRPGKCEKPHFMLQISGVSNSTRKTVDSLSWKECFPHNPNY